MRSRRYGDGGFLRRRRERELKLTSISLPRLPFKNYSTSTSSAATLPYHFDRAQQNHPSVQSLFETYGARSDSPVPAHLLEEDGVDDGRPRSGSTVCSLARSLLLFPPFSILVNLSLLSFRLPPLLTSETLRTVPRLPPTLPREAAAEVSRLVILPRPLTFAFRARVDTRPTLPSNPSLFIDLPLNLDPIYRPSLILHRTTTTTMLAMQTR